MARTVQLWMLGGGAAMLTMKTIFVLDDDHDQAELLAQALAGRSHRVRAFSDPIRALAALNSEGSDLLVADLFMPWLDGEHVVTSARLKHPDLKVILISGVPAAIEIARQHNIPFFSKPVDLRALRQAAFAALGA